MAKRILLIAAVGVAVALAIPAIADAQAIPRTAGSSSSSSSGSSGSSGSTSSGGSSGGSGVVPPPSGGSAAPSRIPPPSSGSVSGPSRVAVVNRGGGKSSGAGDAMRTAPMPGGVAVSAPAGVGPADSSGATVGRTAGSGLFSSSLTTSRSRGDNPITGFAAVRQPTLGPIWGGGDYVSFPFYGPWGGWYPWYTPGFGWYAGYIGYNPWNYAATCWSWGLWGPWYNPYSYCWGSYYFPPGYYGIDIGGGGAAKAEKTTGDLRVLASPKTAKVYIDGALVGTVDEFNGLNRHLEVETGHHVLSLKAEGYQSSVQDVVVEGGRTQTVRISLKKLK